MGSLVALLVAAAPTPVLVELYTSEGCSSCPSADAALEKLSHRQPLEGVEVVALSFHVDYWNRLGWADPFSSPVFTRRQSGYAEDGEVYTPQLVVDGQRRYVGSGLRAELAISARRKVAKVPVSLEVSRVPGGLAVRASAEAEADVFVALAEDGLVSKVTRGENEGRTLPHAWVVREFAVARPGLVLSSPALERRGATLRVVAFAQAKGQGEVLGVRYLEVPAAGLSEQARTAPAGSMASEPSSTASTSRPLPSTKVTRFE